MRLSHLRQAIAKLPSHLSDWTDTDIEDIRWDGVRVVVEADTSELENLREQLKESEKRAEDSGKETEAAEKRAETAEEECDKLREEMAALKDPSEDGESVATYRQRAIDAEAKTDEWREYCKQADRRVEEMAKELAAMRKRKGVEPGVMAHTWELNGFLNRVAAYGDSQKPLFSERAQDVLLYLANEAKRLSERIRATANAGTKAKVAA